MKTMHVAEYGRGFYPTATFMGVVVDRGGRFYFGFLFRRRGSMLYFMNKTREISVGRCAVSNVAVFGVLGSHSVDV